jgi:hypothetical protein
MFLACRCSSCLRPLRVRECYQGKMLRCPSCAAVLLVAATDGAPNIVAIAESKCAPVAATERPPPPAVMASCLILPWILLAPTALALILLMRVGLGVLWAALGVALGGLCLLLGQRVRWPEYLRVSASLSLALIGYGLTLASIPGNGSLLPPRRTGHLSPASVDAIATSNLQRNFSLRFADMRIIARLGDLLSVSIFSPPSDDRTAIAIAATADGSFKEFSYPDFKPGAIYRLPRIAYRTAVDNRRGVLWAAACEPADLRANRYGDQPHGRADLYAYDIPPWQQRHSAETTPLHPRRVVPLGGDVLELLMSADGDALFYLVQCGDKVRLGRIDAARQAVERQIPLPQETRALCLTPDGKALYAAGAGCLFVIDPATLQTLRRLPVRADVRSIAADNNGCVYLAEQGQWMPLTFVDLYGDQPVIHQWEPRMHGRIYVKMSPDQSRLFVGTSSLISDQLEALLINGRVWTTPPTVGAKTVSSPQARVQGEFFLTPDGSFVINRWGIVFRLMMAGDKSVRP